MPDNIFDRNDGNEDSENGNQYQVQRLWSQMEYIDNMLVNPEEKGDEFYNEDSDPEFPEDESQVVSGKANTVNIPKRKKTLQKYQNFT